MALTTLIEDPITHDPESETEYFRSPLGRNWEREAAAQLIEVLGLVSTGYFQTQADFAQRLYQTANKISFTTAKIPA